MKLSKMEEMHSLVYTVKGRNRLVQSPVKV